MTSPRHRFWLITAVACVLIQMLSVGASAQTPSGTPSGQPAPPRVVGERIPTSGGEVLREAAATESELTRIEKRFATPADLEALDTALTAMEKGLDERAAAERNRIARTSRPAPLNDIVFEWQLLRHPVEDAVSAIDTHSSRMAEVRARLEEIRTRWSEIERLAKASEASPEVVRRARDTLTSIDAVRRAARANESTVLDLQVRATAAMDKVDGVIRAVARSRPSLSTALLRRAPIWRAPVGDNDGATIIDAPRRDVALAMQFVSERRGPLVAQALTFLLLVLVMFRIARTTSRGEAGSDDTRALRRAPIASALVLTLSATGLFHVAVPSGVALVIDLVVTAAAFRLVSVCVPSRMRLAVRLALAFVAVDAIRHAVYHWPLADRAGAAVTMVAVVVLSWWSYDRYRNDVEDVRAWARWAAFGLAGMALAALVANVFGYVLAAELASAAAIRGTRLACIAYITYRLGLGLAAALLESSAAQALRIVREHRDLVYSRFGFVLLIGVVLTWAWAELDLLALRALTIELWDSVMDHKLEAGSLKVGVNQIVLMIVGTVLAFGSARMTRFVLSTEVLPRLPLTPGGRHAASTTAGYLVLVFAFIAVLASVGFELGQLAFLAGALGVGIGFGLQSIVNNFVSGLVLLFGRPVEMGHVIVVGAITGEVTRIGFRSSTLRTLDGAEIIVPNAELIANQVTNWTLSDHERRVDVPVGVAYGSDVERVRALLQEAAAMPTTVLKTPEPEVLFMGFGESSLDFVVRGWALFDDHMRMRSDLCFAISAVFAREGIQIPFPQRDLHLKSIHETAAASLARGE